MGGLLGDQGGSKTKTEQGAPQLIPQGVEGYNAAQGYYKNILSNPPIYGGQRVADTSGLQKSAFDAGAGLTGPNPTTQAGENQLQTTLQGGYLGGPQGQAAVGSLADPIFSRFTNEVLPQISDRQQAAGQGVSGTRRNMANQAATGDFARTLGTSAIAPIFTSERANMMNAAGEVPKYNQSNLQNVVGQAALGQQQRSIAQEGLTAEQQKFEEPIFRQSGAAQALLGAAGAGPGGSSQVTSDQKGSGQTMGSLGSMAAMLGAAAILAS